MSVKEATDNQTVVVWAVADGTKMFTSFSPNGMLKMFTNEIGRSRRELGDRSLPCRATNPANDDIAAGRVRRFSTAEEMIASLSS